jgi:tight adherence protein C
MNPLVSGAGIGAICATGLLITIKGLATKRTPLAKYIEDAGKTRPARPTSRSDRALEAIVLKGADPSGIEADLAVLSRTHRQFAVSRVSLCAAFGGLPIIVALLTAAASGAQWNPLLIIGVAVGGSAAGFVISRATLASEAASRRQSFVAELAAYLDIVGQLLSGGAGVEDALWRAARNARSPGIVSIRDCLSSARTRRRSEWVALAELAQRTRVPELTELVTAVQLAGSNGAKVSASLIAKAHSLRDRNASMQLAQAQRASERMGGPLIGMLLAFLVLVIAPALAAVMAI